MRDNKIKIFSGDKVYKNKDETINDLVDGKYFILDKHYQQKINILTDFNRGQIMKNSENIMMKVIKNLQNNLRQNVN